MQAAIIKTSKVTASRTERRQTKVERETLVTPTRGLAHPQSGISTFYNPVFKIFTVLSEKKANAN